MLPVCVLMSIDRLSFVFRKTLGISLRPLVPLDPPVGMVPAVFVSTVFCKGFKGGQSKLEEKSK